MSYSLELTDKHIGADRAYRRTPDASMVLDLEAPR